MVADGWVPNAGDGTISPVDQATNQVIATIPIASTNKCRGTGCEAAVVASSEGIWATANNEHTVVQIDPASNTVSTTISVEPLPFGLAAGEGAIWVTSFNNNAVLRIDPKSGQVSATLAYPKP